MSVLLADHSRCGSLGVDIGFLMVDAPIAKGLQRDLPTGYRADDIIARLDHFEIGIKIAQARFSTKFSGSRKHEAIMVRLRR